MPDSQPTQQPCPHCGREEGGKWLLPCPADDCPSRNEDPSADHDAHIAALEVEEAERIDREAEERDQHHDEEEA